MTMKKIVVIFVICSKNIVNDIVNLGGIERKSLTCCFPNIPEEYLVDFISEYFDGRWEVYRVTVRV